MAANDTVRRKQKTTSKKRQAPRSRRKPSSSATTDDRVSARVGLARRKRLANLAKQQGKSESTLLRTALDLLFGHAEPQPSCYDLAKQAEAIGLESDLPPDLSTNKKYLEGFGRD